ncbi:MAG: hypothetical protein ACI9OB_000490, partial [Nonlabens sp.]
HGAPNPDGSGGYDCERTYCRLQKVASEIAKNN